jgi:hypothetical protein
MKRNLVRVAILVWLVLALRSGLTTWNDHQVPVVVQVPVTATNPTGLETVNATFECAAPIGGDAAPVLVDDLTGVVGPSREPCEPFVRGRQLLFVFDLFAGAIAIAITFAHLPRQWRDRHLNAGTPVAAA